MTAVGANLFPKTLAYWPLTFFFWAATSIPAAWGGQASARPCVRGDRAAQFVKEAESLAGEVSQRAAAYQKALELCPDEPSLYVGLTTLLIKAQRTRDASVWVRRGLARWPENVDLSRNLGVILLTEGHPQKALQVFGRLPSGAQTDFQLGMAYRALGEHDRARKKLASAYNGGQKDPYVLYAIIEQDRALGDSEAGLKDFTTLDKDFSNSAWSHLLMGDAYSDRHDAASAGREYQAAVTIQPSIPVAHFNLGRLAFDRGDYHTAESDFRDELRFNPTFGTAYLYLGETLSREGRSREAIDELRRAITYNSNSPLAYQALATAEEAAGHPEAALETLRAGQKCFPEDAAFPAQQARILKRAGRVDEAAQQAALAEALSRRKNPVRYSGDFPDHASTTRSATNGDEVARASNAPQEAAEGSAASIAQGVNPALGARPSASALASASVAATNDPRNASAWLALGRLQQAAGDQVAAVKSFVRARQLQPRSPLPVYATGMSFFLLGLENNEDGYYQRAARHFQDALELDPRYDRAIFMLGVIDVLLSKLSDACAYFEKAIAVSPENLSFAKKR